MTDKRIIYRNFAAQNEKTIDTEARGTHRGAVACLLCALFIRHCRVDAGKWCTSHHLLL